MKTILRFPDGSAFDATAVIGITWEKVRGSGDHRSPACIRIYGRGQALLSFRPDSTVEQLHYVPMESDEAAREACEQLTRAWMGMPIEIPAAAL